MHKILHDKPEPVAEINPAVPAELRRTIRRCMAKEPERRFQSMKDVAIELAEIVEEFEQLSIASTSSSSQSGSGISAVARPVTMRSKAAMALIAVLVLGGTLFGVYQWRQARARPDGPVAFESMKIQPLTSSGRVMFPPAISPDGKYVAYVTRQAGLYSVWMRQVATGTDVRIVPEQPAQISALVFSPDGNYLYYSSAGEGRANYIYSWLFAVPSVGGGQPRKVVYDVDTAVAFSPDGSRIAFGRGVPTRRENHVIVANADGSAERTLAVFPRYGNVPRPVWHPDGTKIVTAAVDLNPGWDVAPMEIDVASGALRRIGKTRRFEISDLAFLPDGSALLIAAADAETAREQVWLQPYPDGAAHRVTNDLSDYKGLTTTRDASVIAALKTDTKTSLVLSRVNDSTPGTPLASGGSSRLRDVAVSRSGAIVYGFTTGNRADIAVLDTPQSNPRVVTRGGENFDPSISADGRTIVYAAEGADTPSHLFAVDADGSNLRQITKGAGEGEVSLSADGSTIVYSTAVGNEIWVQPLQGGVPRKLTDRANGPGQLSPDGRHVLFLEWQSAERTAAHLKVVPADGGAAILDFPWASGFDFRWHPDGKTITFRRLVRGVHQIFALPISGGDPTQITTFPAGTIAAYDWTADGGLVLIRTEITSDVVLISDWRRVR
jgi:Tol biopolymer transport system component